MSLYKKAKLLEDGRIFIPEDVALPCFPGRSTAGPDAGMKTIAVEFSNSRAKLELSDEPGSEYHLVHENGHFGILKNGETFIEDVRILPTLAHAPNHAFINLSNQCKYGCAFCALPTFEKDRINLNRWHYYYYSGTGKWYESIDPVRKCSNCWHHDSDPDVDIKVGCNGVKYVYCMRTATAKGGWGGWYAIYAEHAAYYCKFFKLCSSDL